MIFFGGIDFRGCVMDYEEGVDFMREFDVFGGVYKRWVDVVSFGLLFKIGSY